MAVYRCSRCDTLTDGDYSPCIEDPNEEFGLMCESCAAEAEEDKHQDAVPGPCGKTKMGEFNQLVCCMPEKHEGPCNFVVKTRFKP